ncbi:uncharacterized protein BJ212DRAFT_1479731 [Suillus subaureus]|uniref:Uncharacterized protein n=1 Tax=Suillus subaureus TaxID=48587 RepID=A0A9P7EE74_9AGAM|nr:uncharacterized protein BJ212DRAFT_1479731 [Suillus subaureus]KAG1818752.1 hypothetical protein BJ212DRAFT_1479731 [Suillus subaureus]
MPIHQAFLRDMQVAFNLSRTQIVTLFKDIRDKPNDYGVIDNAPPHASFPSVVERIETLLGMNSIFPNGAALTVSYQGTNFEFETPFDLVGWILSVTGHIPEDVTTANYYYPLVILYCQWCRTLCAREKKEAKMVQITWYTQGGTKRVCLGSSLDRPKGERKEIARTRRFNMLSRDRLALGYERHLPYSGDGGQPIGHCAETFPILFIKSLGEEVTLPDARGIAVKPLEALNAGMPNKFDVPDTETLRKDLLEDPCDNCEVVLLR